MKNSRLLQLWTQKARELKLQVVALSIAYRDPRTPWYAKGFALLVAAYAFSPIDLIPDFIPVLGYLDDLVLLPLGVFLALRMIPPEVMADCRARAAQEVVEGKDRFRFMAVIVVAIWAGVILLGAWFLLRGFVLK